MTSSPVALTLTVNDVTLGVTQLSGREGVSELFELEIVVVSLDIQRDLEAFAGARAALHLEHGARERTIHGIVSGLVQESTTSESASYRLWLVPEAWLLTQRTDCRIFQAPASLAELFGAVLGELPHALALARTYPPRDLYVQYQESDWAFLCRVMEEAGLYYFFDHDREGCTLIITDGAQSAPGTALALDYDPGTDALRGDAERITAFSYARRVRPALVTTRRVGYDRPSAPTDERAGSNGSALEVYAYQSTQSAESRLSSLRITAAMGAGRASTVRLASGGLFTLGNHPRGDFDGEYLVTSVVHAGEKSGHGMSYACAFECIPRSTAYRPLARTPRPTIVGPQAATVVSAGEEIDVDERGRVLVRLHWDRLGSDDGSGARTYNACRVPVAQMAAGSAQGAMFIPRRGSFVLVEFLDGDPEKPVITGRAFNTLAQHPYALPANKTLSTVRTAATPYASDAHFHELTFQDGRGSEEVYLRAERKLRIEVEDSDPGAEALREVTVRGDDTELITGDQAINVAGKRSLLVGATADDAALTATSTTRVYGDEATTVSGDRTVTIGTATANRGAGNTSALTVEGTRTTTINGTDELRVTGTRSVDVGSGTVPSDPDAPDASYSQESAIRGNERTQVSGDQRLVVNGSHSVAIGGSQVVEVAGSLTQSVDLEVTQLYGSLATTVMTGSVSITSASGEVKIESATDATKIGGNTIYLSAESTIEIRSATSISFVVGSLTENGTWYRKITLDEDGVYLSNGDVTENLTGSHVKINC